MTTTPPRDTGKTPRVAANEETTVLTPVPDGTGALDRIPVTRQRMWIIITSLLTALLLGAGYLIYHLVGISDEWAAQVEEVKTQNYDLGERLAAEQTQVIELTTQKDTLNDQLGAVQERMIELVDDVAQRDDNAEYYARQISDLTEVLTTASGVANALNRCIDSKTKLIEYIRDAENYDPTELTDYEDQVDVLCTNASAANVELQRVIAE